MRNGDILNSIKNVVKGGLPTHTVGDFSPDSSDIRTGSNSGKELPVQDEIISSASGAVFESIHATRLHAYLEKRRNASLDTEVLTLPYSEVRGALRVENNAIARPRDFMRSCALPAAKEISAKARFSVTPSLVRDGRTVVAVSFLLVSREHASNACDEGAV